MLLNKKPENKLKNEPVNQSSNEPVILHLETATNICSVAISRGATLLAIRESDEDRSHGRLLTVFIEEVLKESGTAPEQINALSVSKGPGSYTGLRIGVSAAKGFAYAMNIPVIGIITLQAMAAAALAHPSAKKMLDNQEDMLLCPMIDARRMEVYAAIYDRETNEKVPVSAAIIDEHSYSKELDKYPILFFGNGAEKASPLIVHPNAHFISDINPSSRFMIPLALEAMKHQNFEDTAYFEPYYLKDFVATIPKRKVL
ncbi:MAG: tRNA (adenosine(37)-N6)-threonylcarbamoyltransferase complex dimerization subunit type 1 TsaB [Bacteroidales bacterium]|nr:tRNA (adenosine(37)-N6)-threonylcarbamoyltransferase complex dimerization subunit type 1 TsaB [Bacteroidales bacterium]